MFENRKIEGEKSKENR